LKAGEYYWYLGSTLPVLLLVTSVDKEICFVEYGQNFRNKTVLKIIPEYFAKLSSLEMELL
jgi:hypothetical protein